MTANHNTEKHFSSLLLFICWERLENLQISYFQHRQKYGKFDFSHIDVSESQIAESNGAINKFSDNLGFLSTTFALCPINLSCVHTEGWPTPPLVQLTCKKKKKEWLKNCNGTPEHRILIECFLQLSFFFFVQT